MDEETRDTIASALETQQFHFHISAPIKYRVTPQGGLDIFCFQAIGTSTTPMQTILHFDPDAAGQLLSSLHHAVESGAIVLTEPREGSGLQ